MSDYRKYEKIAFENGISKEAFRRRVKYHDYSLEQAAYTPVGKRLKPGKDIAIYKGDEFIVWGSPEEVAKKLGRSAKSVKFLCYPSYHDRIENSENAMYGIFIEDEE